MHNGLRKAKEAKEKFIKEFIVENPNNRDFYLFFVGIEKDNYYKGADLENEHNTSNSYCFVACVRRGMQSPPNFIIPEKYGDYKVRRISRLLSEIYNEYLF
mgnify:CR=1 FL=1